MEGLDRSRGSLGLGLRLFRAGPGRSFGRGLLATFTSLGRLSTSRGSLGRTTGTRSSRTTLTALAGRIRLGRSPEGLSFHQPHVLLVN